MKVFYSDHLSLPLPDGHRFPMAKYRMLREALVHSNILDIEELQEAHLATLEDIKLAHDPNYVDAVVNGTLDPKIQRKIGFPWSEIMPLRSRASVGGFLAACESALHFGFAGNLSGGTHHAHFAEGGGYCVFNDFAVAVHVLMKRFSIKRLAIVDLDVHQGDGNSSMLRGMPGVFIFSMHAKKNFPFKKVASDLDIELEQGTKDQEYLEKLDGGLKHVFDTQPQIILYQAGVDPLFSDQLGHLDLSFEGLKARDRAVLSQSQKLGIPVAMAMGGGYANPITDTIKAHVNSYAVAKEIFK